LVEAWQKLTFYYLFCIHCWREYLEQAEIEAITSTNNVIDDALNKIFDLDHPHVSGLGFGIELVQNYRK